MQTSSDKHTLHDRVTLTFNPALKLKLSHTRNEIILPKNLVMEVFIATTFYPNTIHATEQNDMKNIKTIQFQW